MRTLTKLTLGLAIVLGLLLVPARNAEAQQPTVTTYSTAGTYTFTVPAGVYKITVEAWGAGGGGGSRNGNGAAGGGGGGAYSKSVLELPQGNYQVVVGAGGAAGIAGGPSSFGNTWVIANGGGAGSENETGGAGGAAGTFSGGHGANGSKSSKYGGGGGSSAGTGANGSSATSGSGATAPTGGGNGGNGGTNAAPNGSSGIAPGGGGGGAFLSGRGTATGGSGAPGQVVITYHLSTWTGSVSPDWNTAGNWNPVGVPTASYDVLIPDVANDPVINYNINNAATCLNLTIAPGASLVVEAEGQLTVAGVVVNQGSLSVSSGPARSGSLIMTGSYSGNGTFGYTRHMTGITGTTNPWHLISAPVNGQDIAPFLADPNNGIAINPSNTDEYGLADYNTSTNRWNGYFTASTDADFTPGKGYEILRGSNGPVRFAGSPNTGTREIGIARNGAEVGWNCVGNPYPSAIGVKEESGTTTNFLTANQSQLDPNFAAIYVWDQGDKVHKYGQTTYYKAITKSGFVPQANDAYEVLNENFVQACQGFFVRAIEGGGTITFQPSMQVHQSAVSFKTAAPSWPGLRLIAHSGARSAFTDVTFHEGMTPGLDPAYDAGLLRSRNDFVLYTRLLEDNGVDFTLQCLPDNPDQALVVPVGLDFPAGGTVTFVAQPVELDEKYSLALEDRATGVLTPMTEAEAFYTVTVPTGQSGTGRFFLHALKTAGLPDPDARPAIEAYAAQGHLFVRGTGSRQATATLTDLVGRAIRQFRLDPGTLNVLEYRNVTPGIYLLTVTDGSRREAKKIILE